MMKTRLSLPLMYVDVALDDVLLVSFLVSSVLFFSAYCSLSLSLSFASLFCCSVGLLLCCLGLVYVESLLRSLYCLVFLSPSALFSTGSDCTFFCESINYNLSRSLHLLMSFSTPFLPSFLPLSLVKQALPRVDTPTRGGGAHVTRKFQFNPTVQVGVVSLRAGDED